MIYLVSLYPIVKKGVLRTTSIFSIFSYRLLIWLWIWQGLSYWPPISRLDCQGCFQIWGRLEFVQPPPTNRCHLQQKQPCTRLAYKWQFGFPAEKRSKNKEIGISKSSKLQVNLFQIFWPVTQNRWIDFYLNYTFNTRSSICSWFQEKYLTQVNRTIAAFQKSRTGSSIKNVILWTICHLTLG